MVFDTYSFGADALFHHLASKHANPVLRIADVRVQQDCKVQKSNGEGYHQDGGEMQILLSRRGRPRREDPNPSIY